MMRIVSLASALVAASSIAPAQSLDLLTVQISAGIVGGQGVPGVGAPAAISRRAPGRHVSAAASWPLTPGNRYARRSLTSQLTGDP